MTFSSLSTRIDLTFDSPKEMEDNDGWPAFDYTVTDDKGKIYEGRSLQVGSTGLYGHHIVLALPRHRVTYVVVILEKTIVVHQKSINS